MNKEEIMKQKEELKKQKEKAKGFAQEFKTFILRGNVLDLAVGVIVGAAFQGLVTSLTNNIISPILGCFSNVDFSSFKLSIGKLNLYYGAFLTDIINFVIMAFVVFLIIKSINKLTTVKKKEEPKKEQPKPSNEELLLTEIRDLLKKKN